MNFNFGYFLKYGIMEMILTAVWFVLCRDLVEFWIWAGVGTGMSLLTVFRIFQFFTHKEKVSVLNKGNYFNVDPNALQKNLKNNPDKIYLGEGFIWENKHVQGYSDILRLPERKEYINSEMESGGYDFLHNLGHEEEKKQYISKDELQHSVIAGTTRVGKTRFIELLSYQFICDREEPLIIIDPKGDDELLNSVYNTCVHVGRKEDFGFFSLAHTSKSFYFNPLLNFGGASDIADRVTSIMPSGGSSEPFVKFSWQVLETVGSVLLSINEPVTLERLQYYSLGKMGELVDYATEKVSHVPEDRRKYAESSIEKLAVLAQHPKDHFQKMITSLGPVLSAFNTGDIAELLNADPNESNSWSNIIKNKKIVYFDLSSMLRGEVANSVGKMIIQDLLYYIGEIYAFETSLGKINLIIDEFYSVMFPGYVDILNKAGGAGLRVFLAMQTTSDIVSATDKMAMAKQILGNINNKFYLRVPEKELAEEFCSLFGKVQIKKIEKSRDVKSDAKSTAELFRSGHTTSLSYDETDLISPEMIMHLPKGQAYAYTQGRDPLKLRLPLLDHSKIENQGFAEKLKDNNVGFEDFTHSSWADYDGSDIEWMDEEVFNQNQR